MPEVGEGELDGLGTAVHGGGEKDAHRDVVCGQIPAASSGQQAGCEPS